jgi:hypothetical protein
MIALDGRNDDHESGKKVTTARRAEPVAGMRIPAEIRKVALGDVSGRSPGRGHGRTSKTRGAIAVAIAELIGNRRINQRACLSVRSCVFDELSPLPSCSTLETGSPCRAVAGFAVFGEAIHAASGSRATSKDST